MLAAAFRRLGRVGVLVLVIALPAVAHGQNARVTFLHFNDVYEIAPARGEGGLAELMTLLRDERAHHEHTITVVSGDFLSPSMLSGLTRGAHMVELFNALGVDFVTFGNHEFDHGPEVTRQRIAESRFQWLGSNVFERDGRQPFGGAVATATRRVGDVTIGFLGVVTDETDHLSSAGRDVLFTPPIDAAKQAAAKLRADGANVIVAVTHLDIAADRELARAVPTIDLILGGHDHDPITYYERGVLIQKSGSDAHFLGAIDLDIRTRNSGGAPVTTVHPSWRMTANAGTAPDPEIAPIVKRYNDQLDRELGIEIGKTAVELDSRGSTVRGGEARIGNLIAEAMREALGADVAVTNGGGIRGNRIYPAGSTLTRKDILGELPFGNYVLLLDLSGAELAAAMENSLARLEDRAGRFPQIAGMTIVYDPATPAGHRLVDVKVAGKPLDAAARYRVATTDFLANGGDGYESFVRAPRLSDTRFAPLLTSVVADYIRAKGTVAPPLDGRVRAAGN